MEPGCQLILGDSRTHLHLARFPNGLLKREHCESVTVKCYRQNVLEKKFLKSHILVTKTKNLHYSGNNFKSNTNLRNCVGIKNKRNGQMNFYFADLFDCEPSMKYSGQRSVNSDDISTFSEQMASLTSAFGSKRKKKAIESRLKFASRTDQPVTSIDVGSMCIRNQGLEISSTEKNLFIIPPRNVNASSPEQVYLLNDIISDLEFGALDELAELLKSEFQNKETLMDTTKYCSFVTQVIELYGIGNISTHKAKILCYFDFLVIVFRLGYKYLRKKDPLPMIIQPFKSNLLNKFTSTGSDGGSEQRVISLKMKDKIIANAVVLALFICNFSVNVSMLNDFKVPISRLTRIAQALGCYVSSRKTNVVVSKFIELRLPLYTAVNKSVFNRRGKK